MLIGQTWIQLYDVIIIIIIIVIIVIIAIIVIIVMIVIIFEIVILVILFFHFFSLLNQDLQDYGDAVFDSTFVLNDANAVAVQLSVLNTCSEFFNVEGMLNF